MTTIVEVKFKGSENMLTFTKPTLQEASKQADIWATKPEVESVRVRVHPISEKISVTSDG